MSRRAVVLSCTDNEKQLLEKWAIGAKYVETSSGKIVQGLKSTYKRNGVLNLFAALHVATGIVKTQTTAQKKWPDFQAFLDSVLEDIYPDQQVHIIMNNYCTHMYFFTLPRLLRVG
jgi:hypothetical protein